MKDFKMVSEAEDSYHIQHKNGKTFTVDKKGLNKKAHEEIRKMCGGGMAPKMADGGVLSVQDPNNVLYQDNPHIPTQPQERMGPDIQKTPQEKLKQYQAVEENLGLDYLNKDQQAEYKSLKMQKSTASGFASGGEVEEDEEDIPSQEQSSAAVPTNASSLPQQTAPIPEYQKQMSQNIDQRTQDVQQYLQEQQKAAQNSENIREGLVKQLAPTGSPLTERTGEEVLNLTPEEIEKRTPAQIQADGAAADAKFMESLQQQAQNFDPQRYFHQMGTGSKIMTGIALALGGAGGGQSGHNAALDVIRTAINNDIEHQKADYANTMNLYKMNHQATQDALQANLQTKNQLISVAQLQLAGEAAKAQNSKTYLDTQMLLSQLQQEKNRNNMAMGLLSKRTPGPGGQLSTDPTIVAAQLIQDPQQRAAALKEIEQNQAIEQGRQIALQNFNHLADLSAGGKLSPADRKSAVATTALEIAKRFSIKPAAAQEMADQMLPGEGLTGLELDTTTQLKRQRLNQLFDNQKSNMGILKSNTGLGPEDFPSTSSNPLAKMTPREIKMYNIAKSHPNHPESIRFAKKYGVSF